MIAAAGLLMVDHLGIAELGVLLLGLAANLYGFRYLKNASTFTDRGQAYLEWLRVVDGIGVTLLGFSPTLRSDNVWLLGIPVLVCEAMGSRDRRRVVVLTSIMAVIQASGMFYAKAPASGIVLSVALLALGAGIGIVLAAYKSREETLFAHDRRLATFLECGSALAESRDVRDTIIHTLKSAVIETNASGGYVLLVDEEDKELLRAETAFGVDGPFEFPQSLRIGDGMSGYVAKMGQPISLSDKGEGANAFDGVGMGVRSAASVPLITRIHRGAGQAANEEVLGVMTLLNQTDGHSFDPEDLDLLRTLGSLLAVAVANARMEERQRTTFLRTLQSLATALEARDEYTRGHSQRVSEVSLMIGERLGFTQEALEELRVGTIMHDIGKIGVPDEILNKRGRLTDEEFDIMKSHPVIGYEICRPLMLSEGVLMIIRNHHEKLDGSGYPDALKGGDLPLSLRIVCVADAFDAMSSRRPYRGVMDIQTVLAELSKGAGVQFDPVVVESLKELLHTERMHEVYRSYWAPREAQAA